MEVYYIHTHITPILTYLRSSLKSSLRKPPNSKAIQKITLLNHVTKPVKEMIKDKKIFEILKEYKGIIIILEISLITSHNFLIKTKI